MPKDCLETIKKFLNECEDTLEGIDLGQIVNMDEKSIYLDQPMKTTYAKRGSKRIKATTSGNERTRFSAAYSAAAYGTKLPIFKLLSRKTELNCDFPDNCK